ncbi:MAG: RnfABCDGE type electron transport complex subunit G, partial [Bacteroidetes bacterium]|nr:RnfABCDGE type electron transport complex subunit G [Bacteroidota bacterium]
MAKLQSSFKNMILSLTLISVGMSAALGVVYSLTKESIAKSNLRNEINALKNVLPAFDNNPLDSAITVEGLVFYKAKIKDSIVGYACKSYTDKGFNGKVIIMTGFLPDGTINKTFVLEQKETPGLGSRINTSWKDQFNGKNPSKYNLKVKKDGGDVDAVSGATISSRAFCDATEKAYLSLMKNILKKANSEINTNKNDSCKITDINVLKKVLPDFDNNPLKEVKTYDGIDVYTALKNKKITGYAIKTCARGYNDLVWILTGILPEGKINNVIVLKNKESVGYGAKVT